MCSYTSYKTLRCVTSTFRNKFSYIYIYIGQSVTKNDGSALYRFSFLISHRSVIDRFAAKAIINKNELNI